MGLLSDMLQEIRQDLENIRDSINNRYTDSGEDIEQLENVNVGEINNGINNIYVFNTNDATATPQDVVSGKYGYAKKTRIDGAIPVLQGRDYNPTTSDTYINAKQYTEGDLILKGDPDFIPENIKEGIKIFNVTGTAKSTGTSIPDTNATSADVLTGKNGYVKDKGLVNGSMTDLKGQDVIGKAQGSGSDVKVSPTPNGAYDTNSTISINAKDIAKALGIQASDILKGETILGIEGTYDPEKEQQNKEKEEEKEKEKEEEKKKEEEEKKKKEGGELPPFKPEEEEEERKPVIPDPQDPDNPIPPEPNFPEEDDEEEEENPNPDDPENPNPDNPNPDDKDDYDKKHEDDSYDKDGKQKEKDEEKDPFKNIEVDKDTDGDGIPDINIDTDGDGKPDLNIDTNGDDIPDINIDTDGDGKPDLNIDLDHDGKPDINIDTNGDGIADINIDVDGDGEPDINVDLDGDGKPDLNIDIDGDGHAELNIDTDCDWMPNINIDSDGDGVADWNIDDNCDEIPDRNLLNQDTDDDGIPDLNVDVDGDGIPDVNIDTDGDGIPDINKKDVRNNQKNDITDIDLDNDGRPDKNIDTDGDGIPDENLDMDKDNKPRGKGDYITMFSMPYDRQFTKKTIYGGWDSEIHDTFAKVDDYLITHDKSILKDKIQNVPSRNTWPRNTYFIAGIIKENEVVFVVSDFIQKGTSIKTILPEGIAEYKDGCDIPVDVHFNFDNISLFHKYSYPKDHEIIVKNNFEFKDNTRMGAFIDSTYYSSIYPFIYVKKGDDGTSYFKRYFKNRIVDVDDEGHEINKDDENNEDNKNDGPYYRLISYTRYKESFEKDVTYDAHYCGDDASCKEYALIDLRDWIQHPNNHLSWSEDVDLNNLAGHCYKDEGHINGGKLNLSIKPIVDYKTGKKISIDKLKKAKIVYAELYADGAINGELELNGENLQTDGKPSKTTGTTMIFPYYKLSDAMDLNEYEKQYGKDTEKEEQQEEEKANPIYYPFEFGNIPYSAEYIAYIKKGGASWWSPAGDCRFKPMKDGAGYTYIKQSGGGRQCNFILPARQERKDVPKTGNFFLCHKNNISGNPADAGYVTYTENGETKCKMFELGVSFRDAVLEEVLANSLHEYKPCTKEEFMQALDSNNSSNSIVNNNEENKKYYISPGQRDETGGTMWCCSRCGAVSTGTHRLVQMGIANPIQASHSFIEISTENYNKKYGNWLNPNAYKCGDPVPADPYLEGDNDNDDNEYSGKELYGFAAIFTNVMDYRKCLSNCGLIITNRTGYKLTAGNGTFGRDADGDTRFDEDGNIIGGEGTDKEEQEKKDEEKKNTIDDIIEGDKINHDDDYRTDDDDDYTQDNEEGTGRDRQMHIIGENIDPKDVIQGKIPGDLSDKNKNPVIGDNTDPDDSNSNINHGEYDTMDIEGEQIVIPNPVLQHQYSDQKATAGNTILLPMQERYQDKNYKEEQAYYEDIVKWKRQ